MREWWKNVDNDLVSLENSRRRRMNKQAEATGSGSKLKILVDPFAPKRQLSAYFLWARDERKGRGNMSAASINDMASFQKEIGAKWRTMSEQDKRWWLVIIFATLILTCH